MGVSDLIPVGPRPIDPALRRAITEEARCDPHENPELRTLRIAMMVEDVTGVGLDDDALVPEVMLDAARVGRLLDSGGA